jgi:WD40 repeat protein
VTAAPLTSLQTHTSLNLNRPEDGTSLGTHSKPVSCMEYSREMSALVTGSWDGNVHIWYGYA